MKLARINDASIVSMMHLCVVLAKTGTEKTLTKVEDANPVMMITVLIA